MATFKLVNSEVKPLTREVAQAFSEMAPSPTERDLNVSRLRHLKEKAEAGLLVTFHWSKAKVGDQWVRMNGQHSSRMLCGLNGEFPQDLFVHMDSYEVDGPEGLALLFRQFDDRKSGRSAGDVAGAYQGLFPDLAPVPKDIAKIGIDGLAWYRRTVEGAPAPTGDDVYSLFQETGLHDYLLWVGDVFSMKTPEMKRPQVMAAMYATFISNQAQARVFWRDVARGGVDGETDHPSTVLSKWLLDAKSNELVDEKKGQPLKLKPAQFYQGCIFAWNAWRQDKRPGTIKADTRKSWLAPVA